jgi:hypothetical protein
MNCSIHKERLSMKYNQPFIQKSSKFFSFVGAAVPTATSGRGLVLVA